MWPYNPYYPFYPWWGYRRPVVTRRPLRLHTYEVTAGLSQNGDGTINNFTIDPVIWRQLPTKCIILLNVPFTIPTARLPLPVDVIVEGPVNTRTLPVVNTAGAQVSGNAFAQPTQVEVYLDKSANIFRIQTPTVAATQDEETPAGGEGA